MACKRFITSYAVSNKLKSVRSLPSLSARCYSTDPDEISKKTHTGQVKSHNNLNRIVIEEFISSELIETD